jgi:hypothetical protein
MSTLIEDLQRQIPRLRAKGTDSANRLADSYQMQLDTYLANPNGSAWETYFSGNPVANGNPRSKMSDDLNQTASSTKRTRAAGTPTTVNDSLPNLRAMLRSAGPEDKIYSSGLTMTSVHGLKPSTPNSQLNTGGKCTKGSE